MSDWLALHGRRSSIVLERSAGAPIWRHWGARLAADTPLATIEASQSPLSFSPDSGVPLTTAPGFGLGWFGPSVLLADRDGRDFTCAFETTGTEQAGQTISIRLVDRAARIALDQTLALDPDSDVLTLSAVLTNQGDAPLAVRWLAAGMLPLPADCATLRSFHGRHNAEFVETREPMPSHAWLRQERRGLTGHAGPPGLFVLGEGADWHRGEVRGVQLAWSGNHELLIECQAEGGWTLAAGAWLAPGEVRLAPGENLATPALLATYSPDGLNGASANFHTAIRARLPWAEGRMRPRPVHLNSWEGRYFDQDEAAMTALAERAAAVGVERFVVDDGWFVGRRDDRAGLGDWTVDRAKYPAGLRPLADHVRGLGMEFGLWVEPEMVNADSDLFRAHPDWALAVAGRPVVTARHQLVLDLSRDEVRDHLFDALDTLLRELPIAYLKWDHNRHLAPAGGSDGRARYVAQVEGVYALIDRLRAAHPAVEIESCAGGGGRIDAAMAARTHRFWASDNLDAVSRVAIQRGFLAFMPPEMMGAHVGASPAHATGRRQSLAFRAAVALPGHFGIELDPARLAADDVAELAAWVARYKALRDRLHAGRTWLGEGSDGIVWQAVGSTDAILLFVTRLTPPVGRDAPVRLPMMAGEGDLDVRLLATASDGRHAEEPALFAAMRGEGVRLSRDGIAAAGLPLPPMRAESVAIFELVAA
ncbi:MAG: alpha-galactosidase [Sphingomonas sp.]|uniref:alpha-galactosidase n=1 Tax=Sphingomonas sp. TaxID=28214 RepID=UPI001AC08F4E|nr:alpha-galactosidase [Sphingomonas sp.]MBN8806641.1 alpha-galactosidase [Sphingomonas sp.]